MFRLCFFGCYFLVVFLWFWCLSMVCIRWLTTMCFFWVQCLGYGYGSSMDAGICYYLTYMNNGLGSYLVVCPAAILEKWERELKKSGASHSLWSNIMRHGFNLLSKGKSSLDEGNNSSRWFWCKNSSEASRRVVTRSREAWLTQIWLLNLYSELIDT